MSNKLHLLGVPHTIPCEDYLVCAFTAKVLLFPEVIQPFGWNVVEYSNIAGKLKKIIFDNESNKPLAVIVHTIKGQGIKEIENQVDSHRFVVSKEKINDYIGAFGNYE